MTYYQEKFPLDLYIERDRLGRGSFGEVSSYQLKEQKNPPIYQGRKLPEWLAVKVVIKVGKKEDLERESQFVGLLSIKEHPNILKYFAYEPEEHLKGATIFMELGATDLKKFLAKRGTLKFGVAFSFAEQIASGIEFIHANDFAHRDLKPANILLFLPDGNEEKATLKLCDFGLIRPVDSDSTRSLTNVGALKYKAPEMQGYASASGFNEDPERFKGNVKACDIYAMGLIFIELFSRKEERERLLHTSNHKDIAKAFDLPVHLILASISSNWRNRPTAGDVLKKVKFLRGNGLLGEAGSAERIFAEDCQWLIADFLRKMEPEFGVTELEQRRLELTINGNIIDLRNLSGIFMIVASTLRSTEFVEWEVRCSSNEARAVFSAIRPIYIEATRDFFRALKNNFARRRYYGLVSTTKITANMKRHEIPSLYAICIPMSFGTASDLTDELQEKYDFFFKDIEGYGDNEYVQARASRILFLDNHIVSAEREKREDTPVDGAATKRRRTDD